MLREYSIIIDKQGTQPMKKQELRGGEEKKK
jgi:hypothetical protein